MNFAMQRRRALMEQGKAEDPWEDITPSFDSFTPTGSVTKVVDSVNKTMRFYTRFANGYQAVESRITLTSGYEYRVKYDVTIVKSKHFGAFVAGSTTKSPTSGLMEQSGHVEFVFQYNSAVTGLKLFCTWSTSEMGDDTISNFSISRRPIA